MESVNERSELDTELRDADDDERGGAMRNHCDRCDGCGWYEGGATLKTTCEVCGGSGVITSPNHPAAPPEQSANEQPTRKRFQQIHRRMLRQRCESLCRFVELNAPQPILDFSAGHLINAIVWAIGPGAFARAACVMIDHKKEVSGVCPFCEEERPIESEKGMCAECWKTAEDAERDCDGGRETPEQEADRRRGDR